MSIHRSHGVQRMALQRLERSRSRATDGAGLGLAIVRAVAEHHGGSAYAGALPEAGLGLSVALPSAHAEPEA